MTHRLIRNGELVLYGPVGGSFWEETGFTDEDVMAALEQMSGDITVRLNSAGGIAFQGIAIYNALKQHDGQVTIFIDALAASAASVIAMAGDTVTMRTGAMLMIHDPSGITFGTAEDHRHNADVLDSLAGAAAEIYASKSGLSADEVLELMEAETWMRGEEAIEKGFADGVAKSEEVMKAPAFDYSMFAHAPKKYRASASNRAEAEPGFKAAAAAITMESQQMSGKSTPAAPETLSTVAPTNPTAAPTVAVPTTQETVMDVFSRCRSAKLTMEETTIVIDGAKGDTLKAQEMITAALVARDDSAEITNHSTSKVLADASDRFKEGASKALLSRAGLAGGESNEFSSLTLRELARQSLDIRGDKKVYRDPLMMIGAAFAPSMSVGHHSTSDFVEILGNIANKSMLKGWEEAGETFHLWTSTGTLSDFKIAKRIDLNLFPALDVVPEGGEYNYGTIGEHGETIQLATYGKMFSITRQAIINDDMNAFAKIPGKMGAAARRTIGNLVYAQLTTNPVMSDGVALFHANHSNLNTAANLGVASLNTARAKMALQKDPDSHAKAGLNIRPAFLLVPVELEGDASVLMNSEFDPAKTQRTPNSVRSMAQVISDARLSTASPKDWYLAGNPNTYDTVEVSYLNGVQTPTLEQRDGWHVDGVEFKVRIDAGVKALDFRALSKTPGE